jgi:HEAT repeat protein
MIESLTALPTAERAQVVSGLVPRLTAEITKPPPKDDEADTTIPFKDAAYAMLTNDGEVLVSKTEEQAALKDALTKWALGDFSARSDNSSQKYGMNQLLRYLGAGGVAGLPNLIAPEAKKIGDISDLVADLGDPQTKLAASKKLTEVASEVNSEAWLKRKAPELQAANKASGLEVDEKRFQLQLQQYQEEELLRIFSPMKKVGEPPAVEYLFRFVADKNNSVKRRAAALAALEGHVDKKNDAQVQELLSLAGGDDTPDEVRDQALRRVGELSRKQVVGELFKLFKNDNWKIRWMAAELVLNMSEASQLDEFMSELGRVRYMAITEPLRYGKLIGTLKGDNTSALVDRFAAGSNPVPVRLTALGYYYEYGSKAGLSKVMQYASDSARVPSCKTDSADCEWTCKVAQGDQRVSKQIASVGDFVQYCVKPAMDARDTMAKKEDNSQEKR